MFVCVFVCVFGVCTLCTSRIQAREQNQKDMLKSMSRNTMRPAREDLSGRQKVGGTRVPVSLLRQPMSRQRKLPRRQRPKQHGLRRMLGLHARREDSMVPAARGEKSTTLQSRR